MKVEPLPSGTFRNAHTELAAILNLLVSRFSGIAGCCSPNNKLNKTKKL